MMPTHHAPDPLSEPPHHSELNGARERCRVISKDKGKVGVSFAGNGRNEAELGRSILATPQVRDLLTLQTCLQRLVRPLRVPKRLIGHRH